MAAYEMIKDDIYTIKDKVEPYYNSAKFDHYLTYTLAFIINNEIYTEFGRMDKAFSDSIFYAKYSTLVSEEILNSYIFKTFKNQLSAFRIEYYTSSKNLLETYLKDTVLANELETDYKNLEAKLEE